MFGKIIDLLYLCGKIIIMNTKVSVILPIYNVAPYLDEAFQSLLSQTLKEFEIIAVNDGSTDNSQEILDRYATQDKRIKVLQQENQGQSVARNLALQHATGEYLYMMDSDDKLSSPDALQLCYDYAERNNADFIFFDGGSFSEEGVVRNTWNTTRTHLVEENIPYEGNNLLNLMLDTRTHNCVVWLLFIRRIFLENTKITFYPGIIHEDELFTTILALKSDNIYCLKQSIVKHRVRDASTMGQRYTKRNLNCYLTVIDELLKYQLSPLTVKFARYTLSKVFYTGHVIPFKEKFGVFWRAAISGYLKYIGWKSTIIFWLKK